MEQENKLQTDTVTTLRTLAHDLSNSLETILQAAYLLAQVKLDPENQKWLELIDKAAHDAALTNRELREILRTQG
jgi:signal transduction histidine kinase